MQAIQTARQLGGIVYHGLRFAMNPDARLADGLMVRDLIMQRPAFMKRQVEYFASIPTAARALREQPSIGRVILDDLLRLPVGTLGRTYAEVIKANNIDLYVLTNPPPLPGWNPTADERFVRQHMSESHDIWHVVTGFPPTRRGEIALGAFYLAQFPSIVGHILVALATTTTTFRGELREEVMDELVRGWTLGRRAKPLFGVPWGKLWHVRLEDVRKALGIDLAAIDAVLGEASPAWSCAELDEVIFDLTTRVENEHGKNVTHA